MINISGDFNDLYIPYKAILVYQKSSSDTNESASVYVESYDINRKGAPINAHPLSLKESTALADLLQSSTGMQNSFLQSKGLLPENLLYVNTNRQGYAVWYTPAGQRELYFAENLGIPLGKANVPPMVWKASRDSLSVFAIKGKSKPSGKTPLYHAPYFNMYADGRVCMGNVSTDLDTCTNLESFMARWEQYFVGSYFSHTIEGGSRTTQNIVQVWQDQRSADSRFPEEVLVKTGLTLNQLIQ